MPLTVAVLLAGIGCRTVVSSEPRVRSLDLTPEEARWAAALAHYAAALLEQGERGSTSEEALTHFLAAMDCDPSYEGTYIRAAMVALQRRDVEQALRILKRASSVHPSSARAWAALAVIYQMVGRLDQAAEAYRRLIRLNPTHVTAHVSLARLQFHQEQAGAAIRTLEDALRKGADRQEILQYGHLQGRELVQAQKLRSALACFEFLERHGAFPTQQLAMVRGELHEALGERVQAERAFRSAIATAPQETAPYIRLALLQWKDNRQEAIVTLEEAIPRVSEPYPILTALAWVQATAHRTNEAVSTFREALDRIPREKDSEVPEALFLHFGAMCEQSGQTAWAEEIFERGIQAYPQSHAMLNYLAYMWAEQSRNLERALEYVRRALEIEPDNGAYLDTLGWIFFRMGRFEEALEPVRRAAELLPEDPTILDHLGDIYRALGQTEEAVRFWKESLRANPDHPSVAEKLRAHGVNPDAAVDGPTGPSGSDGSP